MVFTWLSNVLRIRNCSDLWGSTGHQASHRGAAKHGICFASRLVPSNVNSYSDSYSQRYEPQALTSLLYLCYSLAELNRYRVIAGYTDMATLLMHAVGVEATASGWYGTLRQFSDHRFLPATRGGRARDRYSSLPLLNSILITELDSIHAGGLITDVLSGTTYDARFQGTSNPENVAWPQARLYAIQAA